MNQWGPADLVCSRLKTCTSSCRITRFQLNSFVVFDVSRGDTIATSGPVQAPIVCRSGTATTRPLNISCFMNI